MRVCGLVWRCGLVQCSDVDELDACVLQLKASYTRSLRPRTLGASDVDELDACVL